MPTPSLLSDYPPVAFHFAVWFPDMPLADTSFQEVSGLAAQMDVETVVEGGENRFVHQLPKAMKAQRLVLKRGISTALSPLFVWCKLTLEGGLGAAILPRALCVALRDENGLPLRAWTVAHAWPAQWDVEGFSARKNEVAIEKIELCYAYLNRML